MSDIICYDSIGNRLRNFYQWDVNQKISVYGVDDISSVDTIHFGNCKYGSAVVVTPTKESDHIDVVVPNVLLEMPEPIAMYVYVNTPNGGKRTMYVVNFQVVPRARQHVI